MITASVGTAGPVGFSSFITPSLPSLHNYIAPECIRSGRFTPEGDLAKVSDGRWYYIDADQADELRKRATPHRQRVGISPARPNETPREVPNAVYFDLATWHLINTVYAPARLAELRSMKGWSYV
jgi:hypothetical protein